MSLLPLFVWLGNTPVGAFMQRSTWGFAVVEMVHLLGLALLGGSVLVIDLSLLGFGLRGVRKTQVVRSLAPLFRLSLVAMLVTGVLLLSEEALKCYYSPAFRLKILALALAVPLSWALHRQALRNGGADDASRRVRFAAALSLALWLCVGIAGRAIGFI
jgi:hypothetical protein